MKHRRDACGVSPIGGRQHIPEIISAIALPDQVQRYKRCDDQINFTRSCTAQGGHTAALVKASDGEVGGGSSERAGITEKPVRSIGQSGECRQLNRSARESKVAGNSDYVVSIRADLEADRTTIEGEVVAKGERSDACARDKG